jgi:glycerol-1-phosphate dehydrogenase [NAD(P)+]
MTDRLALPDPTRLDDLRERLDATGGQRRQSIGLGRVRIGSNVLAHLPEDVAAVRRPGPVVILEDETPMRRAGADLKASVEAMLAERFPTRRTVLRAHGDELHADVDALAQADNAIAGAGCVVSVGSGTVTDVAKDASMRAGGIPFVVV